ncbi:MAG TPA: cupin domain-containing protein [Thermoanaerobaculia bacterium]|jgi:mannose-6-phosphate isomerase-like protein (cupin superfamily)|nr:cupin domain-containing protein [Thermoanaerobaculia bacterium]
MIALEGDCRVVGLKEGEPVREGALRIWRHFEGALSLRVLELDGEATLRSATHDETLYVIDGEGSANGIAIAKDSAIDLPPDHLLHLRGAMTLVSSLCPAAKPERAISIVHLDDQPMQRTGDRWYRELIQGETTQFVGAIPPGRAPDHFHLYEEVICILDGAGVMWAGATSTPIAEGSCIFLPRGQRHCVENTGTGEMRLLGVFYPAGSPAVRYS